MNYNKTTELSEEEQVNWLRLLRSTNVGPKTFFKILSIFSSSALALENISDFSRQGGTRKPIKAFDKSLAEEEIAKTNPELAQSLDEILKENRTRSQGFDSSGRD